MNSILNERNVILMDMHHHMFFYRLKRATFMTLEYQEQLLEGIQNLLMKDSSDEKLQHCF
jgi:hypothetical protein